MGSVDSVWVVIEVKVLLEIGGGSNGVNGDICGGDGGVILAFT
jgi:hypothetical protein